MRRRAPVLAAVVAAVVLAGAGVALLTSSGGDGPPIAVSAARLVPADALVFVHLSTDTGRKATKDALRIAKRFPGFAAAQSSILGRLSAPGCPIALATLRKGSEAALALIDAGGGSAGSLILVDTGDATKIRASQCGDLTTEKIGRFYVIGQPQTVQMARQLNRGKGASLAADPAYRRELAKLPTDRVADAWISRDGVRRLLAPQSGLLGVAGTLLDSAGLRDVAAALTPTSQGARLSIRSLRDIKVAKPAPSPFQPFTPSLQTTVPAGSFATLGLKGLSSAAGRLLGLVGPQAAAIGPLLARAGKDLAPLLDLFRGEVSVSLIRQTPAPILTLVVRPKDIRAAIRTLSAAEAPVARLLRRSGGPVPRWSAQGGVHRLRPAPGIEFDYAVFDGLVAVSTKPAGIAGVRNADVHITDTPEWRATIGSDGAASNAVTSLLFLDFSQLLRLGEQTGLDSNKAYLAVKADLQKIKAVGAHTSSAGDESTAELSLLIP